VAGAFHPGLWAFFSFAGTAIFAHATSYSDHTTLSGISSNIICIGTLLHTFPLPFTDTPYAPAASPHTSHHINPSAPWRAHTRLRACLSLFLHGLFVPLLYASTLCHCSCSSGSHPHTSPPRLPRTLPYATHAFHPTRAFPHLAGAAHVSPGCLRAFSFLAVPCRSLLHGVRRSLPLLSRPSATVSTALVSLAPGLSSHPCTPWHWDLRCRHARRFHQARTRLTLPYSFSPYVPGEDAACAKALTARLTRGAHSTHARTSLNGCAARQTLAL